MGYLSQDATLAGGLKLNKTKAEQAANGLGLAVNLSSHEVAVGIRRIITETMAQAAQLHVTESGEDPRDYTLLAFGGAAPLHAFDVAKALGIRQVILPKRAGVLSAFGFLTAKVGLEQVQSFLMSLEELDSAALLNVLNELKEKATLTLTKGNVAQNEMRFEFALDMRYRGQGYDVQVPIALDKLENEALETAFKTAYHNRYGEGQEGVVEIRACRLSAYGTEPAVNARAQQKNIK